MADLKITALTQNTTPISTDIIPMVDDPAGSPLTQKVTYLDVQTLMTRLAAGTVSASPLAFTAGTLKTTVAAGDIEMDSNALYGCTDASNRGYIPIINLIRQDANRGFFANSTAQQNIFDSVAAGTLTLETGTYLFEALVQVSVTSATSGNIKFSIIGAGTATLGTILYMVQGIDAANDTLTAFAGVSEIIATQTAANLATASTATVTTFWARGTFEVTGAGSIIPSVAQTTGTASQVTTAGSFFQCNRIGNTTLTSIGQWT